MKTFKILNVVILLLSITCLMASCKKSASGGGGSTPPPVGNENEENIVFTITPDPANLVHPVSGATHSFTVNITSKLPSKGIDAIIDVKREGDAGVVFNQSLTVSTASFTVNITGLVQGVTCKATIDLRSKGTTTNTAKKEFRLARK
ncbi:MAG: hypothetical protein ACOVNY_12150 [Chitinophagaceae bacterium]|jgi:hypothetical protein